MPQHAPGVTAINGDVNLAGRDVIIQRYYHGYSGGSLDIVGVLDTIRNLRKIHQDILSKATLGTGVWLLKTDKFLIWLDPNGNLKILWGIGIPGAGKTVLASIIINELEIRARAANGQICVAYIYVRYGDSADLTVRDILEILVKQTVERHADCALLAEQAYARHLREKTQPTEAELLELLHQFVDAKAATFYILDALDEAPDRLQVELVQKIVSLDARLLITSRLPMAVEARAADAHCFAVTAQEDDLNLHIDQEIARSHDLQCLLKKAGSPLRDEIVSLVKTKCGGMFLHASLQLDALCRCINAREVRQTLDAFPSRIEDVYVQTWHRILEQKTNHVMFAKAALVWILNASRPMMIEELEHAVATSPDTYKFEPDRLVPGTTLVSLCRGLVTLEEESGLVRLVHNTAKDALQGLLHESFPLPHSLLATICMTHIADSGFQNTTLHSEEEFIAALHADPLLAYASDCWATHARVSLHDEDTRRRIVKFVRESKALPTFTGPGLSGYFDVLRPAHILAIHNLPLSLVTLGNTDGQNIATKILKASPLLLASWHGHFDLVQNLLLLPATMVNSTSKDGCSALMRAAMEGHESVAKLLLARHEIQANMTDSKGWSALMFSASEGHQDVAASLLAHPEIQVNLVAHQGSTALMLAASQGHEGVAERLLEHPEIQVNLVDNGGWSALMKAAFQGHEGIVAFLLACHGIQVNLVDNEGWSALMKAAFQAHEGTVARLLSHPGIEVNLAARDGWTALMLASRYGHIDIVRQLLSHSGIDVNLTEEGGWSALMMSAFHGHKAIFRLFLAYPKIMVNVVVVRDGFSALMLAALQGHEDVVELLLADPGIQVNLVSSDGFSALMVAAIHGHEGIVKRLIAHPETRVNLADKTGWSALMLAASRGHEGIARVLLAHAEIQVNLVNHEHWSALMLAARHGHEGIVRLLLARPETQVNLVGKKGWSALMLAADDGCVGVVALLVAFDSVDVNAVNRSGSTALIQAADGGYKAVVRLLLTVPYIDTEIKRTDDGQSAMSIAEVKGHDGIVELLEEFESRRIDEGMSQSAALHAPQKKGWKRVLKSPIRRLQSSVRRRRNGTEGTETPHLTCRGIM